MEAYADSIKIRHGFQCIQRSSGASIVLSVSCVEILFFDGNERKQYLRSLYSLPSLPNAISHHFYQNNGQFLNRLLLGIGRAAVV